MKKIIAVLFLAMLSQTLPAQQVKWALQGVKSDYSFNNGIACFYESGLYGAIDCTGKMVVKPQYKDSFTFEDGSAIVRTEQNTYGIINREGLYLLNPTFRKIEKRDEASGLYIVTDNDGKTGLFYNNRMVIPVGSSFVQTYNFPIIYFDGGYLNLMTGEVFDRHVEEGDVHKMYNNGPDKVDYHYDAKGEPLDIRPLETSSKGVALFGKQFEFGFVNRITGDTIMPARGLQVNFPFFIHDVMVLKDFDSKNASTIVVDASGKVVIGPEKDLFALHFVSPNVVKVKNQDDKHGLFSTSGEELLPIEYKQIVEYDNDCYKFISVDEQGLYIRKTGKKLSGYETVFAPKDDMCKVSKKVGDEELYGYINCFTGEEIASQFRHARNFSEGLARVTKDGKDYFIDKAGKTILIESDQLEFRANEFSEGVLAVYEKGVGKGYIYNPVRKSGHVYNQKVFADATVQEWMDAGQREFDRKRYANAKEYFYKAMMSQPMNIAAITNYGACLANLGHIEEALEVYSIASDIDPEDKTVLSNVAACKQELQRREAARQQQQQQPQPRQRGSFWSSLYMFCSIVYDSYGAGSGSGGYGAGGDVPSGQSCSYYQSRYNELKAKLGNTGSGNAQRSGTAAGKNAAHSIAPRHASAATSGDYKVINSGRALAREYERQMQSIQRQAQQAGCSVY